jgi:hypothetical protein
MIDWQLTHVKSGRKFILIRNNFSEDENPPAANFNGCEGGNQRLICKFAALPTTFSRVEKVSSAEFQQSSPVIGP